MGSSIVIICPSLFVLIRSIMQERVVDLPFPAAPVTRTIPLFISESSITLSGIPSFALSGSSNGTHRRTAENEPLWR